MPTEEVRVPSLKTTFMRLYPAEVAHLLEAGGVREAEEIVATEEPAAGALVVTALSPDVGARVLAALGEQSFERIAAALDPARLAPLLARLEQAPREERLGLLDPALAAELRELLTHPPGSAGSLMDSRPTTFRTGTTVETALNRLRPMASVRCGTSF